MCGRLPALSSLGLQQLDRRGATAVASLSSPTILELQFPQNVVVGLPGRLSSPVGVLPCRGRGETGRRRRGAYVDGEWEELTVQEAQGLSLAVRSPRMRHVEGRSQRRSERSCIGCRLDRASYKSIAELMTPEACGLILYIPNPASISSVPIQTVPHHG
jgi:hypothetical protein